MVSNSAPKPGEPHYEAFKEVAQWHNAMSCLPTWDEILQVEYVRQRGEINMFTGSVQRYCYDKGLYHAVNWYERCNKANVAPPVAYSVALKMFEDEHGPRDTWITDKLRKRFISWELERREQSLIEELERLRSQRSSL